LFSLQIGLIQAQLETWSRLAWKARFGAHISCLCKAWNAHFTHGARHGECEWHMAIDPSLHCITRAHIKLPLQATFPFHLMLHFVRPEEF